LYFHLRLMDKFGGKYTEKEGPPPWVTFGSFFLPWKYFAKVPSYLS